HTHLGIADRVVDPVDVSAAAERHLAHAEPGKKRPIREWEAARTRVERLNRGPNLPVPFVRGLRIEVGPVLERGPQVCQGAIGQDELVGHGSGAPKTFVSSSANATGAGLTRPAATSSSPFSTSSRHL